MRSFRSALVTGATGFIGSALVQRLLADRVQVTCLVRSRRRLLAEPNSPDLRIIETHSFKDAELRQRLKDVPIDVVFHLASYGVRREDRDVRHLIEGNLELLADLLIAMAESPIRRFVHAGSCSEYGFPASDGILVSEQHPLNPTSLYGAAKAASFLFGNALASDLKIPFLTLRLFGVFGTREAPRRLLPYLIRRLASDQMVDLTPGEQVRDLLYEDDVVEAFISAAEAQGLNDGAVYNVCSGCPIRVRAVGEAVAYELGKPLHLLQWGKREYRSDEPMWLVGDNRRFASATGWQPSISLPAGIRRMISAILPTSAAQQ
jgi:UDP-glucose 4-epimerase